MNLAIQKTISLILLILIGVLLKQKIRGKEQLAGIKVLILCIALPATIFFALLKIEVQPSLFVLPILALAFNIGMYFAARLGLPILGIKKDTPRYRTLLLLVPSLAPGLSCFPFILEYIGEDILAKAAFADVGNKVFVLIILYMIAMHFYYQNHMQTANVQRPNRKGRIKELIMALLREPVNLVMVAAMILLAMGFNLNTLPFFIQDPILRMSALMTPLVLLFIGLAVKYQRSEFSILLRILLWRSGLSFMLSGLLLLTIPALSVPMALLVVIFPQSACSFWPFAHMSAISALEANNETIETQSTFNLDFALNLLAISLPLGTLTILAICSSGELFATPMIPFLTGLGLLAFGGIWDFLEKKVGQKSAVVLDFDPEPVFYKHKAKRT